MRSSSFSSLSGVAALSVLVLGVSGNALQAAPLVTNGDFETPDPNTPGGYGANAQPPSWNFGGATYGTQAFQAGYGESGYLVVTQFNSGANASAAQVTGALEEASKTYTLNVDIAQSNAIPNYTLTLYDYHEYVDGSGLHRDSTVIGSATWSSTAGTSTYIGTYDFGSGPVALATSLSGSSTPSPTGAFQTASLVVTTGDDNILGHNLGVKITMDSGPDVGGFQVFDFDNVSLTSTDVAVPEPASLSLLGLGSLSLLARRRRHA